MENQVTGIIGGADGPTAILTTSSNMEGELFWIVIAGTVLGILVGMLVTHLMKKRNKKKQEDED